MVGDAAQCGGCVIGIPISLAALLVALDACVDDPIRKRRLEQMIQRIEDLERRLNEVTEN